MQDSNTLTDINKPVNGIDIKIDGNEKKQEKITEHLKKERIPPDKIDYSIYCEGDKIHSFGKIIDTLIINDTDYIVFLDEDHFVQWYCKNSFDKMQKDDVGKILNEVAMLETKSEMLLANFQLPAFRRLLGEAIARLIADIDVVNAENFLTEAETFLYERSIEKAKIWYILSSAITSTFFILVGILLWIFKENVETAIGTDFYGVIYLSMFGSLVAFSSIISRTNKMKLEPAAGIYTHVIDATTKIVGGIIGAFIVIIGIKSNLLSAIITNHDMSWWLLIFFAIIAGASERFVPDIIKKYEVIPDKEENQQTT